MNPEILIEKLAFPRAYRKVRLDIAHWVIVNPETFPQLLDICFKADDKTSYKAAWILEYVCTEKIEVLIPYFDLFFKNLPNIYQDQAVRPFSKICLLIAKFNYVKKDSLMVNALNSQHKKVMIACCFDWLITNQKVATEVYSMSSLFLLGTEIDWIHPELKVIIKQNMNSKSAAYCARGRITLEKILKFNKTKYL